MDIHQAMDLLRSILLSKDTCLLGIWSCYEIKYCTQAAVTINPDGETLKERRLVALMLA